MTEMTLLTMTEKLLAPGDYDRALATGITNQIKTSIGRLCSLVMLAHEHRAWLALGYSTWEEYVAAEFSMSRSRSYQLLDQAEVVRVVSTAVSTTVDIGERAARDIKPLLGEVVTTLQERLEAEPVAEPAAVVEEVVASFRRRRRSAKRRTDVVGTMSRVTIKLLDVRFAAEALKPSHFANRPDEAAGWARRIRESMAAVNDLLALLDNAAIQPSELGSHACAGPGICQAIGCEATS